MAGTVVIRPVGEDERAAWEPLWNGYLAFYKATLAPGASDVAWQRFHDPAEPMFLLGAYVDGKLTGIVQYLFHRSSWTVGDYCYLQDLFVSESARGLGLGRALIEAVYEKARAAGASRVHWLTQTTNAQARILYDQVADNSGFMQYRKIFLIVIPGRCEASNYDVLLHIGESRDSGSGPSGHPGMTNLTTGSGTCPIFPRSRRWCSTCSAPWSTGAAA